MKQSKKKYMRDYQANRRGSTSYKTMAEDSAVLVALAAGEITVSCAANVLGTDIVSVREKLAQATAVGVEVVRVALHDRMAAMKKSLEELPNGDADHA